MSPSEEFHDQPETFVDEACTPPLDKATVQCPRGQGTLEDEGERGWRSPSSPSLGTQARRALEKKRRRILEEMQEIQEALFYLSWKETIPGHEIRPLGAELAKRLATRKEIFYATEHRDLNLGIAFLYLMAVDESAFLRLAIDEPTKNDVRLLRREYWKIAGDPSSAVWEADAKTQDRHRRRQRAMIAKRPARYLEPQFDQARKGNADYARKLRLRHDVPLEELLVAPDNPHEEVLASFEETLTLERCLARLSSKEKVAFNRWWAGEPPLDNAEACALQRAKRKIKFYFESRQTRRERMDMTAAETIIAHVDERFDRIERFESMRAETMDDVRRTVEKLAQRFPEDERRQDAVAEFLDEEDTDA
jgi:hypothetical protein